MKKISGNLQHNIVTKWRLLFLLFIIACSAFIYIASVIVVKHNYTFDMAVINFVKDHETLALIHFMMVFTFFGSAQFLLPAYILLIIFYLIKKNKTYPIYIAILGISSTALMFLLKNIFKRHRPLMPLVKSIVGYSFPSGHALSSFIFCSLLAWLIFQSSLDRSLKYTFAILLMMFTITIGLSRIILNVHYASDVIGGFCMGYMMVAAALMIVKNKKKEFSFQLK